MRLLTSSISPITRSAATMITTESSSARCSGSPRVTLDSGLWWATAVLLVSALLNLFYLVTIPLRAFIAAPKPGDLRIREARAACLTPILVTASGCVLLFLFPQPLYRLATEILQ